MTNEASTMVVVAPAGLRGRARGAPTPGGHIGECGGRVTAAGRLSAA